MWYCSCCVPARVVTDRLADTLEDMAEIAGAGQEVVKSVAQALRRGEPLARSGERRSWLRSTGLMLGGTLYGIRRPQTVHLQGTVHAAHAV